MLCMPRLERETGEQLMAQKNATPSKEQQAVMKRNDLQPACWTVLQDLHHSMIVRHRITGEVKVIDK